MGRRTSEFAPSSSSNNNPRKRKKRDAHDVQGQKHHHCHRAWPSSRRSLTMLLRDQLSEERPQGRDERGDLGREARHPGRHVGCRHRAEGHARKERDRPPQRRARCDLESGPGRRARHLAADLLGRAGLDAPLLDAVTARDQGPADRRPARDRDSRRPAPAPRRHAQGRRQGRPRRHLRRRRLERAERHAHRPPRHRGAPRAVGRRRRRRRSPPPRTRMGRSPRC